MTTTLGIGMADKRLMEHLRLGGATSDAVGRDLVTEFIEKACREPHVQKVIEEQHATPEELGAMYAAVVDDLLPDPCIDAGPPVLVPTVFFMEPERLQSLLIGVDRDAPAGSSRNRRALLLQRAIELGRLVREEANSNPERSRIDLGIRLGPGLQKGRTAPQAWSEAWTCLSFGLPFLALGLFFMAMLAVGVEGVVFWVVAPFVGVLVYFGFAITHRGLSLLPWPFNLCVGLAILCYGLGGMGSTYRFVASATRTEGVVADAVRIATDEGADIVLAPIVRFSRPHGEAAKFTVWRPWRTKYRAGAHVAVLYDPAAPAHAALDSFGTLWLDDAVLTLFGATLVGSARRRRPRGNADEEDGARAPR